ncbi:MAG: hypothetical protein N3A66_10125, partial [Planctomycetota bacterium]|nr:hypothetical protein [Planctomycetota bacterium]
MKEPPGEGVAARLSRRFLKPFMRHFLDILDHSADELEAILAQAALLKRRFKAGIPDRPLIGKCLGMIFEKPSLRTRVSLEAAMASMGGTAIDLQNIGVPLDARESLADQARTLSRYVHIIAVRCFGHRVVETLAKWSAVPVINALSDYSHPTQALADIMTLREHLGDLRGRVLAFVGDGNNVARSLAGLCGKLGMAFAIASPPGYELDGEFLSRLHAACPGAALR